MADQEFLASYGVDIDEEGVKRLETILAENEKMGNSVSSAFNAANSSIEEYLKKQPKVGSTDYEALKKEAQANNTFDPSEAIRGYAQTLLTGTLADWKDPDDPTNVRSVKDWALQNMETMSVGMATRDSQNARKEMVTWQDYGLSTDPKDIPGYSELQEKASEMLREPISKAREYMQQAMDAEAEGLDGTEYVDKIVELLEEPFEKVREMYDSFDFGDIGGDDSTGEGVGGVMTELNEAKTGLSDLREDAQTPVNIKGNASQVVSAARTAIENVRSLFSETFILNVRADTKTDQEDDESDSKTDKKSALRRSVGGRFSSPTYVEVAEDGDEEYIIPIRKENRALPLIRQMMNELSPDARQNLTQANDQGQGAEVKNDSDSTGLADIRKEMQNALGSAQTGNLEKDVQIASGNAGSMGIGTLVRESNETSNNNVSAPVTINVHASGADAKKIGQSIYNTAERYLLRTMKGAMA